MFLKSLFSRVAAKDACQKIKVISATAFLRTAVHFQQRLLIPFG
jgi:hypothetical protein